MSSRAPRNLSAGAPANELYEGLWAILARAFLVPREPPEAPPGASRRTESFRPARAYYTYLRTWYLLVAVPLLLVAPVVLMALARPGGWAFAGLLVLVAVAALTLLVGYLLLRLRFDTTWYVMTDRALRVRRGVLTIREGTVTYENVQNVRVRRGPLQRWLGIGDVQVETAAAGKVDSQRGTSSASQVVIEGVDDPVAVRDRIVERTRRSRSGGLGDEEERTGTGGWSAAHVVALREIRGEVERLARART